MNYQQYYNYRLKDLDKLATILPEVFTNLEDVKIALGVAHTSSVVKLLEGFRKNLCDLLEREVHPAECDVYVKLVTSMAEAAAIKEITSELLDKDKMTIEDLLDTEKMVDKLVEKTCNNLGAIIHGFDGDEIKKFFGDSVREMLARFGGIQGPQIGDMFDEGTPNT
jgi:hypothetical protein